jgi:hypothetical protein
MQSAGIELLWREIAEITRSEAEPFT